jgi:siderophore synthetase component
MLLQRRHGLDTPTTRVLTQEAAAWQRWINLLARGSLEPITRHLAPIPDLVVGGSGGGSGLPQRAERAWRGAVRETAARVLLAGVREQLLDGHASADTLHVELQGGTLELPLRRRGPFGLHSPALERELDPRVDDPLDLLDQLCARASLDPAARARVGAELLDSLVNLAQARVAGELRQLLAHERDRHPDRWPADPRFEDPEHFVIDGHPWHPMARTRLGLSRAAVVRHAPEQLALTWVSCVDVDAELTRTAGDWAQESTRWFGAAAPGFVRIPIHPASPQTLHRLFGPLFERGAIRAVEQLPLRCRSLLSLRTVALAPTRQLKLACPVHTTSTRRLVSPMSVHNGPLVSRLIADIQRLDPVTATLQLLPESAAAGLEPDRVGAHAGELGAILRVTPPLVANEHAWVCAAIGERWPGTQALVLERACDGYPGGRVERVTALIDAWITKLVPPALRLFSVYGIALELHTQNTLAHVQDGRLRGIFVRDLGGIRIHTPRLNQLTTVPIPSFAARSFVLTDDLDEVRGKLEHTLFHAHLTSLFATAGTLGVDELECWAKLRQCLADCYARWGSELHMSEPRRRSLAADLEAFTRPQVRAKALLRMRLFERSSDYEYASVDNILRGP